MTNKKIVKNPTPESSPFLYYGDDNKIIENFDSRINGDIKQSFSPVSFDDISTVKNLKEKYHSMTPKMSWAGKFCDFFNCSEEDLMGYSEDDLMGVFLFLPIILIEIFATLSTITLLDYFIDNELLFHVLLIIIAIAMPFYIFNSCCFAYDKIKDFNDLPRNMKYHINFHKKDKKLLQNKIFLHITNYKERKNYEKIIEKIDIILNKNTDSIDLYELKNLYNEYMRLLSFMITNKDNISQELYDNYDKQLEELSFNIIKESNNIIDLINDKDNYVRKNKEELDIINQELLDNDAMTVFPMK